MDLFPGGYSNLERFIHTSSKSLYLLAKRDKPFLLTCFVANAKFKLFFHSPFGQFWGCKQKHPGCWLTTTHPGEGGTIVVCPIQIN